MTLRRLLAGMTLICVLLALAAGVFRWYAIRAIERRARSDLYSYGGVYSTASAAHSLRTAGGGKGWSSVRFHNYVAEVDLSLDNWLVCELQGKVQPVDAELLRGLGRFGKLRTLSFRDRPINDNAVRYLGALDQLRQLDIRGTHISRQGRQQLQAALPRCEMLYRKAPRASVGSEPGPSKRRGS